MSSQWLKTLLLFSFVFVSFFVVDGGNVAEASSSLKQKLIEIEEKRNSNDQQTKETKKEIEKLEKEIKNVVTVVAKATHYWTLHRSWFTKMLIHLTGRDIQSIEE